MKTQKKARNLENISKTIRISSNIIKNHQEYMDIIANENTLRTRFFNANKLSEQEKQAEKTAVVKDAISILEINNKEIKQLTVSHEIGVSNCLANDQ